MKERMEKLIQLVSDRVSQNASECYEMMNNLENIAIDLNDMADTLNELKGNLDALDDVDPDAAFSAFLFWDKDWGE